MGKSGPLEFLPSQDRVAQMKAEATRLEITAGVTSFGRYPRPLDHMPASAGAGRLFSIR